MIEYQHLFALNDLELGKTSKVKHKIKLSNPIPFKDRYHYIPPHEFEEVWNHLQDMLKVGAIRKSVSPWASPVVLVRKKDGSLKGAAIFQVEKRDGETHLIHREPLVAMEKLKGKI